MPPNVPPPFVPRPPTGEIDTRLAELSTHLRGLSAELTAEREARQKDKSQGISITNISVPLLLVLAILGAVIGGGIGVAFFISKTNGHVSDQVIHANANDAIKNGGIAYKKEVIDEIASAISDVNAEQRRVNRAVRGGAQCKPSKIRGEFSCAFVDPETLKLRPP